MIGQRFPVEVQSVVDPETGARVTRYVHERGEDQIFYYSQPSITADGRWLVFSSTVSGRYEIHAIPLAATPPCSVQVTDGVDWTDDHFCVDYERNWVFYHSNRKIMRTDLDTLKSDVLFEIPEGFTNLALSANGKYVAFSYHLSMNPGKPAHGNITEGRPQLYMRPLTMIIAVDLATGEAKYVWGDHNYLGHIILSPCDKELVMFADQSTANWQSEIYVVPVKLTDDKRPLRLFENNSQRLTYVGHEWFTTDGWIGTQMMEYTGILDRWNNYTDSVGFNAIIRPDGTRMRRARFPGRKKPIHVHASRADSWWVGDSTPLPRGGDIDKGLMCLIRNHWEWQEAELTPLYRHRHTHERPFHVHPWISDDESRIVFACKHNGRNCVHILDLKAFLKDRGLAG